jgi:hypothetical protein
MRSNLSRRFSVFDAVVALAAVCAGIALARATAPEIETFWPGRFAAQSPRIRGGKVIRGSLAYVLPVLAAWTPALLFLRLRQPRPPLRRVFRQPGTVACIAATLAMSIELFFVVPLFAFGSRFADVETLFIRYSPEVSFAIIGSWSVHALTDRTRSEPSWIDLAGRITGAAWIACTALEWASLAFP